jgi:hypothetical protein
MWPGQTVVIVGGGQSLSFTQLRIVAKARMEDRCRVIAINDQVFWCWWADWLHGCDLKFWLWHSEALIKFQGIKTTLADNVPDAWVSGFLKNTGQEGFDPHPHHVRTGGNGVYQMMHASIQAGAKKVVLIGVDMRGNHCHSGHPDKIVIGNFVAMKNRFETLKPALKERGIDVVNCSPGTELEAFPKADIEAVLAPRLR